MAVTEYMPQTPAVNPTCLPSPPGPRQEASLEAPELSTEGARLPGEVTADVPLVIAFQFQERGLIRLLRREVAAVFQDSRMTAVCQKVALSAEDKLLLPHQLRKRKILMKVSPNQVPKPFPEDSKCQNLLPLFVGHKVLLVSEEPRVKEMVWILRTLPFLPLLGRCIDDTILSRQGFLNYSNLPSLPVAQGELVVGLTRLTAQTHSLLQHQPLQLTTLLDQYIRQHREKDSVVSTNGKPDPPDPVPDSYPAWLASSAHKYTLIGCAVHHGRCGRTWGEGVHLSLGFTNNDFVRYRATRRYRGFHFKWRLSVTGFILSFPHLGPNRNKGPRQRG
ncbi:39S ribosomal protein L10, mitochondrial-like [Trachypithecus francoisi]|uniref:39S ribosomal protein L10, mitochondrial-like n=1 Tax=Trachypithecus francoisi TaxID=54180 RepID=UPI00141A8AF0|nr:39S ribosomal protein L10, mitochondrial-like [Trachypithecus francoisi]